MVGLSLLGYVKVMLFIRRITFVRDFTPSRGPGTGKVKAMVSLLSSKYAFFSGYFSTNWLRVLEIDDVGAHLVQEGAEMRGADDAPAEALKPILQPLDVVHVQMASRLVKHEHVRIHELCGTKLHLHLPTPGVRSHRVLQVGRAVRAPGVPEADRLHELLHIILLHRRLQLVHLVAGVHHPPPPRLVHAQDRESVVLHPDLLVLDLVLNEDTLQLVPLREALKL